MDSLNVIVWIFQVLFCIPHTNSCIFYSIRDRMIPRYFVTENHTVSDFHTGCEFECYKNPDKCKAANIVRQLDGTYLCQFVSLAIKTENIDMLENNPRGKYISRFSEGWYLCVINFTIVAYSIYYVFLCQRLN
jgi:hypothetical protein